MNNVSKDNKAITIVSIIFIAIGILFNEWTIGKLFSHDGSINHLSKILVVRAFNAIAILIGLLLLKYRHRIKVRGREIVFTVVTFVLFLFMFEGGMRVYHNYKNMQDSRKKDFTEQLGWKTQENWSWTRSKVEPRTGEIYKVDFSTTKYGFRVFGDPGTDKFKILVIGDWHL